MQSLTITLPNGPTIRWESDNVDNVAIPTLPSLPGTQAVNVVADTSDAVGIAVPKERVIHAVEARSTVKPTGRITNKPKQAKPDSKDLLAQIRTAYRKGDFDVAVRLCPTSWKQVMQEIARASERSSQPVTLNPASTTSRKVAKRVTVKPKAPKVKGTVLAGAIEPPAKCSTPDVALDRTQDNATADSAVDLGIDVKLAEMLREVKPSEYASIMRSRIKSVPADQVWGEVSEMTERIEDAARIAAAANDRLLTATLDTWLVTCETLAQRIAAEQVTA